MKDAATQEVPVDALLVRALSDPGAFTARGDDYCEPLVRWQARAITAAGLAVVRAAGVGDG